MLGKLAILLAVSAFLAGCEERYREAFGDFPPVTSDIADSGCASGQRMKLTGLCTQDDPAAFAGTTPDTQMFEFEGKLPDHCVWRAGEAQLADEAAFVFRWVNCRARGVMIDGRFIRESDILPPPSIFDFKLGKSGDLNFGHEITVAAMLVGPSQTAEEVAIQFVADHWREQCVVRAYDGASAKEPVIGVTGRAFTLHSAKPVERDPCTGPFFWEARPGMVLRRVNWKSFGIDPASYTLYTRDPSCVWRKSP